MEISRELWSDIFLHICLSKFCHFFILLGKIPYYTMPPTRDDGGHSEAKIVSEFGKAFDADEVYGTESSFIGSLKSAADFNPIEVPANAPIQFDDQMLEVCEIS